MFGIPESEQLLRVRLCLVSTNAKNIVEYDYDYVDIWFNKIQGNLRVKKLMEITPTVALQYSIATKIKF